MYRMSHSPEHHLDTSQAYQPNPMADTLDALCKSCTTTWTLWQTLAAICVHNGLLSACTHLTHGHMVSSPISLAKTYGSSPLAAHTHLHTSGCTLVPVIIQPHYINRSSDIHPSTYAKWSLDPVSDMHDTLRITSPEPAPIIWAEMQPTLPKCMNTQQRRPW